MTQISLNKSAAKHLYPYILKLEIVRLASSDWFIEHLQGGANLTKRNNSCFVAYACAGRGVLLHFNLD